MTVTTFIAETRPNKARVRPIYAGTRTGVCLNVSDDALREMLPTLAPETVVMSNIGDGDLDPATVRNIARQGHMVRASGLQYGSYGFPGKDAKLNDAALATLQHCIDYACPGYYCKSSGTALDTQEQQDIYVLIRAAANMVKGDMDRVMFIISPHFHDGKLIHPRKLKEQVSLLKLLGVVNVGVWAGQVDDDVARAVEMVRSI